MRIVTLDELEAAGWRTPLVLLGTGSVRDLCQASSPSQWAASPLVPPSGAKPAPLLQRTEALVKARTLTLTLPLPLPLTLTLTLTPLTLTLNPNPNPNPNQALVKASHICAAAALGRPAISV